MTIDIKLSIPSLFKLEEHLESTPTTVTNTHSLHLIFKKLGNELSALSPTLFSEEASFYLKHKLETITAKLTKPAPLIDILSTSTLAILRKSSPEDDDIRAKNIIEILPSRKHKEALLALYPPIYTVKNDGLALKDLAPIWQDNFTVVETAVSNNGLALEFASPKLKENPDIADLALTNNWNAIAHLPNELFPKSSPISFYLHTLGYKINPFGGCFGYSLLGIQALLIDDFFSFIVREKTFICAQERKNFSLLDKVDFAAFAESLCLYSDFAEYSKEFGQETTPYFQWEPPFLSTPIRYMLPQKLVDKGGFRAFPTASGIYTKQDLLAYFTSLHTFFGESPYPFGVLFGNANHAIGIGYSPKNKQWLVINIRNKLTLNFSKIENLAKATWVALLPENEKTDYISVGSKFYVTGDRASFFRQKWQAWRKSPTFHSLHEITRQKASLTDGFQYSWIMIALISRDLKTAYGLLKHVNSKTKTDALITAIEGNYLSFVKKIIDTTGLDVNKEGCLKKRKPLVVASAQYNPGCTQLLLKYKAKTSLRSSKNDMTALMAAAENDRLATVKLLISHDPTSINETTNAGQNALTYAVAQGHTNVVDFLLRKGANYLQKNTSGYTSLLTAILSNKSNCTKKILDWDLSTINWTDQHGNTPLLVALSRKYFDCVKILLEADPSIAAKANNSGLSPFILAEKKEDLSSLKLLANTGFVSKKEKGIALVSACQKGHREVVSFLLKLKDVDIDATDPYGMTGLMIGASQKNTALCCELLEAGADPRKKAYNGYSAYFFASIPGARELSDILFTAIKTFEEKR